MKENMKIMIKMIIKVMVNVLAIQFLNNNKLIKNLCCKISNNNTKFNTNILLLQKNKDYYNKERV